MFQSYPTQLLFIWVLITMGLLFREAIYAKNHYDMIKISIWIAIGLLGIMLAVFG